MLDATSETGNENPYEPLAEGDVRLLTITSPDAKSATCELCVYQLSQAPAYDAVSYCWGEEADMTTILCNGKSLRIRKTLFGALHYLTNHGPAPARPLWIDAICLNQADDREKAVHVPLMGDVYKSATRCIAWLGVGDEDLYAAMLWIQWVLEYRNQEGSNRAALDNDDLQPMWSNVKRLLARPWFSRLWILQEVILSPRITMLCGQTLLEWSELVDFDKIIRSAYLVHRVIDMEKPITTFLDSLTALMVRFLDQFREMTARPFSLGQLLYLAEKRECKEPVDRVWAMMGLLSEATKRQIQAAGIIDYSLASRQNYWRSYAAVLKELFEVDLVDFWSIITRGQGFPKHPLLPSWCPDWNASRLYNPLQLWNLRAGYQDLSKTTELSWSKMVKSLLLLPDTSSLLVAGHQVDTIKRVSTLPPFKGIGMGHLKDVAKEMAIYQEHVQWMEECIEIAEDVNHTSPTYRQKDGLSSQLWEQAKRFSGKSLDMLCQTLVAFGGRTDTTYPESWQSSYEALLNHWKTWQGEEGWDKLAEELANPLTYACSGRRFFSTVNGRIGIGPPDMVAGDKVCLVIGGEPLFVLRLSDEGSSQSASIEEQDGSAESSGQEFGYDEESFRLIGDTYVHGLMFGEAFTQEHTGPERYFKLV